MCRSVRTGWAAAGITSTSSTRSTSRSGSAEPQRLVVDADALLDDPTANGGAFARFLGIDALEPGANFAAMTHGLGKLPVRFARGHFERYLNALAESFATLEA